ncbi:hypothetical protein [Neorhizobium sp. S3-V5DH]|uniref:hypothetical protein n=1 Tax=Neorhizobium sp. S3-V5DH TaxID=2485166 RepID=UPI001043B0B0|nr:hypothetical protein [Neorhizobium sp. S3-V5DH]TCV72592.1 hypothetical protein EDE09_104104 [Neorhizobium sp. S3-V5DH]
MTTFLRVRIHIGPELEDTDGSRIKADGQASEFIAPTDDEIALMVISDIAASAEEAEVTAIEEARRMYLAGLALAIESIAVLCTTIFLF